MLRQNTKRQLNSGQSICFLWGKAVSKTAVFRTGGTIAASSSSCAVGFVIYGVLYHSMDTLQYSPEYSGDIIHTVQCQ